MATKDDILATKDYTIKNLRNQLVSKIQVDNQFKLTVDLEAERDAINEELKRRSEEVH